MALAALDRLKMKQTNKQSHPLDNNLQALSPQMQSLKLNPESLREAAESSNTF